MTPTPRPLGDLTTVLRFVAAATLAVAAGTMAGAVLGGLLRLGVPLTLPPASFAHFHGPLMVSAFFGAVIAMERAVSVRRRAAFLAPIAAAAGGLALVLAENFLIAGLLFCSAGILLVGVFAYLLLQRFESFTFGMALGALAWTAGNVWWTLGHPVAEVVPWWAAFLVLTIAGERLELARLRMNDAPKTMLWTGFAVTLVGLLGSLADADVGVRLVGAGFCLLAGWLGRNDIASATIRMEGAPRYMAVALFAGYFWLAVAGVLAVVHGAVAGGPIYDAVWHAVFVGFVFSMVFAHAQVIIPALTGVRVRHGLRFYLPLAALHLATALRLVGDLADGYPLRRLGGIGNAVAIALFAITLLSSIRRGRRPGG